MNVLQIDPLGDARWDEFVQGHPHASVFHTRGWLNALRLAYGYVPVAYAATGADGLSLSGAIPFCRVQSWLTGRRLVALPFSDHCDPLVSDAPAIEEICAHVARRHEDSRWNYVELRPRGSVAPIRGWAATSTYCFHALELSPSLERLFANLHKDSIQRKIRRAEREKLAYQEGRSEKLLRAFCALQVRTRRRHGVVPQPYRWFRSLAESLGEAFKVRVAFQDDRPVASIVTLRFRDSLVYKYGASDERVHNLGGMAFLFWKAIEDAKALGLREMDFGRSDWDNPGLLTFKDRWGAARQTITYWRREFVKKSSAAAGWKLLAVQKFLKHVPPNFGPLAGRFVYRHLG